ncbi:MAG TPA: hypothetical protein VGQ38_00680 [Gaiellaceae bacterium]|jgi:hypothetical protein|nr:hypothetical protein [Gaiellaceae bacterium]
MLIAVTAVLTGIFVPRITDHWAKQDKAAEVARADREKALVIKTSLVRQIGTASAEFLTATETARMGKEGALDAPYRSFAKDSYDIASQLAAYVDSDTGRPTLKQRWMNFEFSVRNAYELFAARPGRSRNLWVARLSAYFGLDPTVIDGLCFPAGKDVFDSARRTVALQFQQKESAIVAYVVDANLDVGSNSSVPPGAAQTGTSTTFAASARKDQHACNRYFAR